jgi:hypothetical protein
MAEYPAMNDLLAYLTAHCCQGDAEGCDLLAADAAGSACCATVGKAAT